MYLNAEVANVDFLATRVEADVLSFSYLFSTQLRMRHKATKQNNDNVKGLETAVKKE